MDRFSNTDRWRHNLPCDDAPRLNWRAVAIGLLIAGSCAVAAKLAHGAEDRLPQLVIFSLPGCTPCEQLKQAVAAQGIDGYEIVQSAARGPLFEEFLTSVSEVDQELDPAHVGPLAVRPRQLFVPIVWIRGRDHYWIGYRADQLDRLRRYAAQYKPAAGTLIDRKVSSVSPPLPSEPFDGVRIVVAVGHLTEALPEFRAEIARRADRVLQELSQAHVGSAVRAHLVTEIADPGKFSRLSAAVGLRPDPAACFVLVPEKFNALKGLIVKQVHAALGEHFLIPLQQAGVHVILERLHGATYDAVLDVIDDHAADGGSPFTPENGTQFFLAAWLTERSNLARRLLARLGLA